VSHILILGVARYNVFTTPSSEANGLEPEHYPYYFPEHDTTSISSYDNSSVTPTDSFHGIPEYIPSISHTEVYVDTLSPYDIRPPVQPPLYRQYSRSAGDDTQPYRRYRRSASDGQDFGFGNEFTPGLHREFFSSQSDSSLKRSNKGLRAVNNTRSISPGDWEQANGDGVYNPGNDVTQASPSSSTSTGRDTVVIERIRAACSVRRLNPVM
jgi:hypothetical protein